MERSKKVILSLDIGGFKIGAIWRGKGKVLKRAEFATPRNKKAFLSLLRKFFKEKRIEIGVAGVVSGTKVVLSPNIPYLRSFDFKKVFPKTVLRVDNDARVFLREKLSKLKAKKILAFTIGTGIGRALAEGGRVKKIKKLEYPEKWEREYQKIRDKKSYERLAEFLEEKLSVLIKRYKPEKVVLGGGVLKRRGFYEKLRYKLKVKIYA